MRSFHTLFVVLLLAACSHPAPKGAVAPKAASAATPAPKPAPAVVLLSAPRYLLTLPNLPGWQQIPPQMRGGEEDASVVVLHELSLSATIYVDVDLEPASLPAVAAEATRQADLAANPGAIISPVDTHSTGLLSGYTMHIADASTYVLVRKVASTPNANLILRGTWPSASSGDAARGLILTMALSKMDLATVTLTDSPAEQWVPVPASVVDAKDGTRVLAYEPHPETALLVTDVSYPSEQPLAYYVDKVRTAMTELTLGEVLTSDDGSSALFDIEQGDKVGCVRLVHLADSVGDKALAVVYGQWARVDDQEMRAAFDAYVETLRLHEKKADPVGFQGGIPQP